MRMIRIKGMGGMRIKGIVGSSSGICGHAGHSIATQGAAHCISAGADSRPGS